MFTQSRIAQHNAFIACVLAVGFGSPMVSAAQPQAPGRMSVDVVTAGDSSVQVVTVGNAPDHDLMAYRFRVERAGAELAAGDGVPWEMTIVVGGDRLSGVQLTAATTDVTFPRPLGVRIGAGDSLHVLLSFADGVARAFTLRLSIEYEPLDRPECRIAVVPVSVQVSSETTDAVSWDWTAGQGGRLLAIAGVPMGVASSVTLSDVEGSVILWSATRASDLRPAFGPAGAALRLGVPVVAGRTYRLTVNVTDTAAAGRSEAESGESESPRVIVMVLPSAPVR